ncbi:MAG: hypothetical protein ACLPTZ_25220 [Beijerinckiaceae bacterium]
MKAPFFAAACAAFAAIVSISSPSIAQEKTVKQCQDEWRANKAENQAKGIKEKDYVAQCRGAAAATPPASAPAQAPSPPPPASAEKGKTAKECRSEWRANKTDNEAKGITEKQYVEQCRTGGVTAAPAPPPAPAATPAPARAPAPATTIATPPPAARTAPTGAGQYRTEAEAKGHCPADSVVWVNLKSNIYHFAGTKSYGTTKEGAYMCEREAVGQGDRASKREKHP